MYNISVCVPTYKRPAMLKKTILSILDATINKEIISIVNIIIVDNDIDRTAEKTVNEFNNLTDTIYNIYYYNHSVKGLSNVRNQLLRRALVFKPDYIIGVDDDEYVTKEWFNQLIITLVANKAQIAFGPVIPVFEAPVSRYVAYWFKYNKMPNNTQIYFFETGNFIIASSFLKKTNIKFDNRFNSTGGEDNYFGITALKNGAKIFWAAEAIAYETIPDKRATLKWLLKRRYRGAITYVYVLKLEKKYGSIGKKMLVSLANLVIGILAMLALLFPIAWRYWGLLKIAETIGAFAGLINIQYHEYNKQR